MTRQPISWNECAMSMIAVDAMGARVWKETPVIPSASEGSRVRTSGRATSDAGKIPRWRSG